MNYCAFAHKSVLFFTSARSLYCYKMDFHKKPKVNVEALLGDNGHCIRFSLASVSPEKKGPTN